MMPLGGGVMSEKHDPTKSEQAGGPYSSATHIEGGFPFVPAAGLSLSAQTVINPEGRPHPVDSAQQLPVPSPSSIWWALFPQPGTSNEPAYNPVGLELGHFRIEDRIRSGGMGAVFRARDTRLNRVVALKVLPPSHSRDAATVQRFRNEAQAAAQLDHENIARVFYIGEDHGLHFIAFEYINGTNIRELIEQQRRLEPADAVNYALQVASALVHTSAKGVVHRDIKPSNIIITGTGRAKLVDLGLARNENKEASEDLTLAGTTLGTFDYISPEQAKDPRNVDVRSDIYSLGCTLYHMLAGEPPYPEGTVLQKLLDHQGNNAPDLRQKNRKVSEDLAAIVRKMMASDPRRRYQTAEELMRDLMLIAGAMGLRSVNSEGLVWLSSQAPRPSFWERHLGWITTVAALFVIVAYLKWDSARQPELPPSLAGTPTETRASPAPDAPSTATNSASTPFGGVSPLLTLPDPAANPFVPADRGPAQIAENSARDPVVPMPSDLDLPRLDPDPEKIETPPRSPSEVFPPPQDDATFAASLSAAIKRRLAQGTSKVPSLLDSPPMQGKLEGPTAILSGELAPGVVGGDLQGAVGEPASRTEVATIGSSSITEPLPPSSPPSFSEPQPPESQSPFFILGNDRSGDRAFPTLEAACAAAVDGSIIELRFNGLRQQNPVRIRNKVTIKAGRGYRPIVEMVPVEVAGYGPETRMITISSGSLDLVDVNLLLSVRDHISTDHWVLFSVQRPDHVRLQGTTITIQNPQRRSAVIAEILPAPARNVMDMEMADSSQPRASLEFEISNSLLRGSCNLFDVKSAEGARFSLKQSLVALEGTLLRTEGTMEVPFEAAQNELRLDHVTAVLNQGLIRMEGGDLPRRLIPVLVSVTNNIFTTTVRAAEATEPFIAITGSASAAELQKRLLWSGQKNFYDGFQTFWSTTSLDGIEGTESMDFSEWRSHWGPGTEVDAHADVVLWQRQWSDKRFYNLVPADFTLDRTAPGNNPAISGAINGDAGVDITGLERLMTLPIPLPDETTSASE